MYVSSMMCLRLRNRFSLLTEQLCSGKALLRTAGVGRHTRPPKGSAGHMYSENTSSLSRRPVGKETDSRVKVLKGSEPIIYPLALAVLFQSPDEVNIAT